MSGVWTLQKRILPTQFILSNTQTSPEGAADHQVLENTIILLLLPYNPNTGV